MKNGCFLRARSNWRFNADANSGYGFAIFMANVGTVLASRSRLDQAIKLGSPNAQKYKKDLRNGKPPEDSQLNA